ncbi:MAG: sensor histidine kinase [Sulfurovum sp.]|nr:sensor histidine kinase [Sulfurovum sp.]
MLSLRDIFLRKIALIFLVLFIVLGASVYFWIKDIYIEEAKKDLLHNIDIISISINNLKNIDEYTKTIKEKSGVRVTIIDSHGVVIAESNKDKSDMDNHKFRDEIIEAGQYPYGYSIRHSATLDKELLYVAKKVDKGAKTYFIRTARDIDEIMQSFIAVSIKTTLLFGLFILFAYWMILGTGSSIQKETQKILNFLDEMGSKEKDREIRSDYSIEFKKITKILTDTSQKLSKRRKQKSKYTAKLKLANRQKDDIISAISHEFKNPIAVISGYTQTLIDDKEINPEVAEKFLSKIHSNAHKLSDMIDRLRLFIRLDENKHSANFINVNIISISKNAVETLMVKYPDREVLLKAVEPTIVRGDATLMEIAIINLIENAIKYSDDAAVEVTIDRHSLKVKDKGIGIPKKEINNITKKFYRIEDNNWDSSMGIGLSLVSDILAMHEFALHISSIEEIGSTFEIKFKPKLDIA